MSLENDLNGSMLNQPINIGDLISNGTNFQINANFDDDFPNNELFDDFDDDSDEDDDLTKQVTMSPWQNSFQELRSHMVKINDKVYKRIISPGVKENGLVPDRARVSIHYNGYWEKETSPFDSTYLRGSPLVFHMTQSDILSGILAAVSTMHMTEEAQFVISHKLLFGKMGCPPRIKPKADGLFIIKLLNFADIGDDMAVDQISEQDRRKFAIVMEKVKDVHIRALDCFKLGKYHSATKSFHKAVSALQLCTLTNEEEQKEQEKFLLKLYTNLAVCYNKLSLPTKTCLMCKEIRRLCDYNRNCKALFQEGRALILLGEYRRAKVVLEKAQRLEPFNQDINKEIKLLAKKYETYQENEKQLWTRAIGIIKENDGDEDDKKPSSVCGNKFDSEMRTVLQQFKEKEDVKSMTLPVGLSSDELESIRQLATDFEMKVTLNPLEHIEKSYSIMKIN